MTMYFIVNTRTGKLCLFGRRFTKKRALRKARRLTKKYWDTYGIVGTKDVRHWAVEGRK